MQRGANLSAFLGLKRDGRVVNEDSESSFQGSANQRLGKTSDPQLANFIEKFLIATHCPLGVQGMKTPASPALRRDGRVVNEDSESSFQGSANT